MPANKGLGIVAVDPAVLLKLLKRRVHNGASPGPSGWTGSHLQLLAECEDEETVTGLCMLVKDICNGVFSGATRHRLLACVLMPISKGPPTRLPNGRIRRNIRPIAMGEVFFKLAAHYSMSLIEEHMPQLFPRIQFGVKRAGGSESAAQLTRALLTQSACQHPSTIALKTDFQNAFNSASRAHIWRTLLAHRDTQPIWRMFHWAYSSPSKLLLYGRDRLCTVLESLEGVRQGCPFAAFAFALGVQPLYEAAVRGRPECHAVSIQDDLTLVGPQDQVFAAFRVIQQQAGQYQLTLRVDKCAVYLPDTLADDEERSRVMHTCSTLGLAYSDSLETLGVMLGNEDAVAAHAEAAVRSHEPLFACLEHPAMPTQVALLLLRYCTVPRLGFLARTVPPEHFRAAAQLFDERVQRCFQTIVQLRPESLPPDTSAEQLREQIQLSLKAGGMGLRPAQRVSHAAYFASAAAVLADFIKAFPAGECSEYAHTQLNRELEECRAQLLADGVTGRPHTNKSPSKRGNLKSAAELPRPSPAIAQSRTLQESVADLWRRAQEHVSAEDSTPFLHAEQVQQAATHAIEQRAFARLHAESAPRRQTLLTALTAAHCSDFLTVLPTQRCYRMADEAMRLSVRKRLGVLPFDSLSAHRCFCRFSTSFSSDPDHFHSCDKTKRKMLTQRHNNVVQVLADVATLAGFTTIREPNLHVRPTHVANQNANMPQYNTHADLLLLRHDLKLYVDVTIPRPTKDSSVKAGAARFTPLKAAAQAEYTKHAKYRDIAQANGYDMFAFALESYGGMGPDGSRLLRKLASFSRSFSPRQFLLHAYRRLSVTLQSSNANISLLAMQQLHLQQHARNRWTFDRQLS